MSKRNPVTGLPLHRTLQPNKPTLVKSVANLPKETQQEPTEIAAMPVFKAHKTIRKFDTDLAAAGEPALRSLHKAVLAVTTTNSLQPAEEMLMAQALALESVFHRIMQWSMHDNVAEIGWFETLMKLGLKAQNQCRMTLEMLANIKNSQSISIIKQTNLASTQQVVNNGHPADQPPASPPPVIDSTPQLEHMHDGQYLAPRTAGMVSENDLSMAALGEDDRTEDARGQGPGEP